MKKQLICESKIKLVDYAFQTPHNDNAINVLDSMAVINELHNINSGTISLLKTGIYEYRNIGELDTEYAFVQVVTNYPVLLNFAVGTVLMDLKTSNFIYTNSEEKIKNIYVSNQTLNTIPRDIEVKYVVIESFDYKYTTFGYGDFHGL